MKKTSSKKTPAKKAQTSTVNSAVETRQAAPKKTSSNENQLDDEGALNDLFIDLLKDIYWAEKLLVKKLPAVAEAATSEELKTAITEHWNVTKEQVRKVEQVFESIGEEPRSKKCEAMKGLSEEVEEIIDETDDNTLTRDVGIIISAQKVEHYEIAAYGGLVALAKVLGHSEAEKLLSSILEEEKEADSTLSKVAEEKRINEMAAAE